MRLVVDVQVAGFKKCKAARADFWKALKMAGPEHFPLPLNKKLKFQPGKLIADGNWAYCLTLISRCSRTLREAGFWARVSVDLASQSSLRIFVDFAYNWAKQVNVQVGQVQKLGLKPDRVGTKLNVTMPGGLSGMDLRHLSDEEALEIAKEVADDADRLTWLQKQAKSIRGADGTAEAHGGITKKKQGRKPGRRRGKRSRL